MAYLRLQPDIVVSYLTPTTLSYIYFHIMMTKATGHCLVASTFIALTTLRPALADADQRPSVPPSVSEERPGGRTVHSSIVWKMFAINLSERVQTASGAKQLLMSRVGTTDSDAQSVISASDRYLRALSAIDVEVEAYVVQRYGVARSGPTRRPQGRQIEGHPRPAIRLPRGVTRLKDELQRTGYLAQIEERQQRAVDQFCAELRAAVTADVYARIDQWVTAEIRPNIAIVDAPAPGTMPTLRVPQR